MAVKRSLWSLTLLPGERTPLFVQRDFCLTNAALGEELRSETGRTVVKVTHQPIPASLFDDDSESDEDDETEDEFELDEVEGFKLTPKKAKANGDADDEEDEEEEEEDKDEKVVAGDGELEEDSEDDSDFSDEDDGLEQTNVLCSLLAGKIEQATLNLMFCEGDVVVFEATGENSVHLMGNYVIQPEPDLSDSEYDSEDLYDGPDDFDEIYGDEDDSMDDEMDGEPDATIEEIVEKPVVAKAIAKEEKRAKVKVVDAPESSKKRKAEEAESPAPKPAADTEGLSKSQKKKLAKKAKLEAKGEDTPAPTTNGTAKGGDKQKKTLPSGLIIEDVKVGDGPVAKPGKRLGMRYIGKLENGKQFDANTSGAPFNFRLGRGEVIKGWDEGLSGMAVGGERRLTIPAALAYGSQKLPGIPKNSTLKFDVKLVSVS